MPIQINKKIKNKKCVIGEVKTGFKFYVVPTPEDGEAK